MNQTQRQLANALADRDKAIDEARKRAERRLVTQLRAIMATKELTISRVAREAREVGLRGLSSRINVRRLLEKYPEEET